jgi:hypothetical protein
MCKSAFMIAARRVVSDIAFLAQKCGFMQFVWDRTRPDMSAFGMYPSFTG